MDSKKKWTASPTNIKPTVSPIVANPRILKKKKKKKPYQTPIKAKANPKLPKSPSQFH